MKDMNRESECSPERCDGISAVVPDWRRERCRQLWDPPRRMLRALRAYQRLKKKGSRFSLMRSKWFVLTHRFWSAMAATDVPLTCQISGGLALPHGVGIVIHPDAEIGPNCLILQNVTIVADARIGGHVDIGAGAKIIRAVSIGNHARIGANAVVLSDVPEGATAVGVPARIVGYSREK